MSRITFLMFISCLCLGLVNCHLIGRNDIATKDIKVNTDDEFEGDVEDVHKIMGAPLLPPDMLHEADFLGNRVGEENKQCVPVGQFCMNHGDCCSNACLGYMKRCVSG